MTFPSDVQRLIEREMTRGGFTTQADLLRCALEFWGEHHETRAALAEALAEADAGLGRPWEQVDREFREHYGLPTPK